MPRQGATISKGRVGPNVSGTPFKISALVTTGLAVTGTGMLALGTVYALLSVEDAKAIGLNAAYDITNNVAVYEHVAEYFRLGGQKLYLQVNAQTVTLAQMIDDTGAAYARKVITQGAGDIHQIAIGFNPPATGYTETITDGFNSDVRAAIVKAQALHDWSYSTNRPVSVILEGRGYGGTATSCIELRQLPASGSGYLNCDMVSVVIAQDWNFAATLTGLAQKHAAIGTFLGTLAACDLNQSPAEEESFNLTDEGRGKWLVAGLSDHTKTADGEAALDTLFAKSYIFADVYIGASGYRWTDTPTCAPITVDADGNMNHFTIEHGRTMNYLQRRMRAAMLPFVKRRIPVNPKTGLITLGAQKEIEGKGNDVIADFGNKGWLSGGATAVDPTSDVTVARVVKFGYNAVPYGNIGTLTGSANLKIKN